ncbi:hypothetical protein BH11MYX1_BH11MYX1_07630 [soil metagenome]
MLALHPASVPREVKRRFGGPTIFARDFLVAATKMRITVGSRVFTARFIDNATATAFKALLPLTVSVAELNRRSSCRGFPVTWMNQHQRRQVGPTAR